MAIDDKGNLYQYDINDNFKEVQKTKIHFGWIWDIKIIDNYNIITSSTNDDIIITNLKTNTKELIV